MNHNPDSEEFQVRFAYPDFSPYADGGYGWMVRSLSWSLPGGADTAVLFLAESNGDSGNSRDILPAELVGCPVNIVTETGQVIWSGWIESVVRNEDKLRSRYSTRSMVNCVIARFHDMSDAADVSFGRWITSDWVEEPDSIARFGRKEYLGTLPYMNAQAANRYLTNALSGGNAWPALRLHPADKEQPDGLQITARGWWQRLDWVLDGQNAGGRELHLEGGKTHLEVGRSLSQSKLAQSWQTDENGFEAGQVWLRCAMVGEPLDNLQVSLHDDNNGVPGTQLASGTPGEVSIHGGWQWISWTFSQPVAITAGMLYWLILERSASTDDTNFYTVQSDDGRGYMNGSLKRWNGSAWIGINHDLRFCCMAVRTSSLLISEILQQADKAPFLKGVQVWQDSGLQAVRWREIGKNCRATVQELLAMGTSDGSEYSLLINPQRYAEIFQLPRRPFAPLSLRPDGELLEASGEAISWDTPLLGREVLVRLPSGQFRIAVKNLRWRPEEGLRLVER